MKWTFDDALSLVRTIQTTAWASGYSLSLGGGVLNKGESENDLDIVVMPGVHQEQDLDALLSVFNSAHFPVVGVSRAHPGLSVWKLKSSTGKKIDLIIPKVNKKVVDTPPLEVVNSSHKLIGGRS